MKQVGIWIDKKQAKIVSIVDGKDEMNTIDSEVEHFHVKGGSGTSVKGGPQDVVQDSKFLEREKHQLSQFFQKVVSHISGADLIVLLGPAQTAQKLKTELSKKHPQLHQKVMAVEKADSMTDKEFVSWVKNYFILKR